MKVLVAFERSGVVRDAFIRAGHKAVSCDLAPTEVPGPHIEGDVTPWLRHRWDLLIAHPPCTYLASSGIHWNRKREGRAEETELALNMIRLVLASPSTRICMENPVGIISTRMRQPDQIINPYEFGSTENKRTCLWLKNLPKLEIVSFTPKELRTNILNNLSPSEERAILRSKTFPGVAEAMAQQWGNL